MKKEDKKLEILTRITVIVVLIFILRIKWNLSISWEWDFTSVTNKSNVMWVYEKSK